MDLDETGDREEIVAVEPGELLGVLLGEALTEGVGLGTLEDTLLDGFVEESGLDLGRVAGLGGGAEGRGLLDAFAGDDAGGETETAREGGGSSPGRAR